MAPLISVVIPTIPGREAWLEKALWSYVRYCDHVETLVYRGLPSCGDAWDRGGNECRGDYIAFGADDVEMHPGWWEAAAAVCDRGLLPAPLIFNADGSVQSCGGSWARMEDDGAVTGYTRGPFVSRAQWERVIRRVPRELHYYTDDWFSFKGRQNGVETVVCHGFAFTHHLAPEGRNDQRMGQDGSTYHALCNEEAT